MTNLTYILERTPVRRFFGGEKPGDFEVSESNELIKGLVEVVKSYELTLERGTWLEELPRIGGERVAGIRVGRRDDPIHGKIGYQIPGYHGQKNARIGVQLEVSKETESDQLSKLLKKYIEENQAQYKYHLAA